MMKFLCRLSVCLLLTACAQEADPKAQQLSTNNANQGYLLLSSGKPREAVPLFDQAIKSDAKNVRAYQGKGIALDQQGKHQEAEGVYKKALSIDANAIGVINNLGLSYILRGQYDDAIKLLLPYSTKEPVHAKVIENLAMAYCLKGDGEQAKKLYKNRLKAKEVNDNLAFCKRFEQVRKGK